MVCFSVLLFPPDTGLRGLGPDPVAGAAGRRGMAKDSLSFQRFLFVATFARVYIPALAGLMSLRAVFAHTYRHTQFAGMDGKEEQRREELVRKESGRYLECVYLPNYLGLLGCRIHFHRQTSPL